MALIDPLLALGVAFAVLAVMLLKRVSIGIALVSAAIVLSLLSMDLHAIESVWTMTSLDPVAVSLVAATFGIMLLALLYRETGAIETLSEGFGGIFRDPRIVVGAIPAMMGLLPVPGGALMSAPVVEKEAEKLGFAKDKKTYANVWFRHIIFPVYPMSQVLILVATLTGVSVGSIIPFQIPIVVIMGSIGYLTVLRKASHEQTSQSSDFKKSLGSFLLSFSPIVIMILTVVIFNLNVAISAYIGIAMILLITQPKWSILTKSLSDFSVYQTALAAFGAMLLRNTIIQSGISEVLGQTVASWGLSEVWLLLVLPACLGFIVGSPTGSIAISVPILAGSASFTGVSASLLFMSAYLGYLASPAHLCLALTADYFKSSLSQVYRLLVPSIVVSFAAALVVYVMF